MNNLNLTAIYARVSTARQEEEQTINNQIASISDYADRNNLSIIQQYLDEGWSGDSLARPALDALRDDAKKGLWNCLLIYDPDRLARRYSYQELIMDELKELGIQVLFVTISTPKNSEDKILYGVRGLFAEYERAKISERFRLGKVRKVKEGNLLVSEPLYGFTYVPKHENIHGYYLINEDEANIVRMIFNWFDQEVISLKGVTKRLLENGIKPRRSKRGVWNTSTIGTMLRNTGYVGEARWGSSSAIVPKNPLKDERYKKNKKTSRIIKPKDEWYMIPIPQIIDREVFERVQKKLQQNRHLSIRNTKNEYLLAGKIKCSCGRSRGGEGALGGRYLYYRCLDKVLSHPLPRTCNEGGINVRVTDKLVWEALSTLMTNPEQLAKQLMRWNTSFSSTQTPVFNSFDAMETEKAKLKVQEERYNKAYGQGLFSLEQLKQYIEPIRSRVVEIDVILTQTNNKVVEVTKLPSEQELSVLAQESMKMMKNLSFLQKKGIVRCVLEKVVANPKQLIVTGNIPLNFFNVKTSYRYGQFLTQHSDIQQIPFVIHIFP